MVKKGLRMPKHKAIFDFDKEVFPVLVKYNDREYEIKSTMGGGLQMVKHEGAIGNHRFSGGYHPTTKIGAQGEPPNKK